MVSCISVRREVILSGRIVKKMIGIIMWKEMR